MCVCVCVCSPHILWRQLHDGVNQQEITRLPARAPKAKHSMNIVNSFYLARECQRVFQPTELHKNTLCKLSHTIYCLCTFYTSQVTPSVSSSECLPGLCPIAGDHEIHGLPLLAQSKKWLTRCLRKNRWKKKNKDGYIVLSGSNGAFHSKEPAPRPWSQSQSRR